MCLCVCVWGGGGGGAYKIISDYDITVNISALSVPFIYLFIYENK